VENPAIIDLFAHDPNTDRVRLVMIEERPWDGSEMQLFQLQEKLNAYLSFVLDGEMLEAYPALAEKQVSVELECAQQPSLEVFHFLGLVRDQIAFQGITLEVRVKGGGGGGCGGNCSCHSGHN
jgi:hypothetical protein